MTECVFCMIASGDIPAAKVYEDDVVCAFHDLGPQAPVHVLIIPRAHYANLGDDVPAEVAAALLAAVPKVAAAEGLEQGGYRVVINTGDDAGQTVHHLHVHVMGGRPMAHGMVSFAEGA